VIYLAAEHFVRAPQWTWYILGYFFFAGLTGGSYAVATLMRMVGDPRDEPAARIGFYASFVALLFCPLLLTIDLGASWWKFWHMLIDVTPGDQGLNFKYWSPMSVGVWALLIFALFPTVSALESYVLDRRARGAAVDASGSRFRTVAAPAAPRGGILGRAFNIVGGVLALFIASYTGVLLSVSNQPIWSDTWMLGGLFLASGLSGSGALIALVGIGASLVAARGHMRIRPGGAGESAVIARAGTDTLVVSVLVLLGVLALRAAVIFSAQ
jgi:formate-dependent nitrite reductase membrane component NrfD